MSLFQPRSVSASNVFATPHVPSVNADVVCGTDFTKSSLQAAKVAAVLATHPVLVHVVDERLQKDVLDRAWESIAQAARDRLQDEQETLQGLHGAYFRTDVRIGNPIAMLREEAETQQARLVVVGAPRMDPKRAWSEMSVAEGVAEAARIPTLVVREAASFREWLQGERRLRVFVGADLSAPSESALYWADWLRNIAPCEIFAAFHGKEFAHVESNEIVPSLFLDEMVSKAAHFPERLFESRVRRRLGLSHVHMRFWKSSGQSADTLIQLASRERADLMIVGTHSRRGWRRIGHSSVSRFVLRHAPMNVLVCPKLAHLR